MNAFAAYQQTTVETQSRGGLIVMLYDGAIKFMKQAILAMEADNIEEKHKLLIKAQNIIDELNTVLDMEAGGEISQNLRKLYIFMHQRLTQANIKNEPSMVQNCISIMEELNAAWKAVADTTPPSTN